MITEIIKVSGSGAGTDKALKITEKAGLYGELTHQESIRLRLLSEELIGLMRGIAGNIDSDFWIENTDKDYSIHIKANISMDKDIRKEFLNASTSGKNAAAVGLMGKLRELITVALLPSQEYKWALENIQLYYMSMGCPQAYEHGVAYMWTLRNYKNSLDKVENTEMKEAWDELEKSIVGSIADDVQVSVIGSTVEITIIKKF